jgi:hypothetical protein
MKWKISKKLKVQPKWLKTQSGLNKDYSFIKFHTDVLNIFLKKTSNVAINKIFKNLKTRRQKMKNIFKVKRT